MKRLTGLLVVLVFVFSIIILSGYSVANLEETELSDTELRITDVVIMSAPGFDDDEID